MKLPLALLALAAGTAVAQTPTDSRRPRARRSAARSPRPATARRFDRRHPQRPDRSDSRRFRGRRRLSRRDGRRSARALRAAGPDRLPRASRNRPRRPGRAGGIDDLERRAPRLPGARQRAQDARRGLHDGAQPRRRARRHPGAARRHRRRHGGRAAHSRRRHRRLHDLRPRRPHAESRTPTSPSTFPKRTCATGPKAAAARFARKYAAAST